MSNEPVYIASAVRTPMGGFQGALSSLSATDLGATAIAEAISRARLSPADIEEVIMGCVLPAGLKQGPARQAMLKAGLPVTTGATTINKLCGSGMKAVMLGMDGIRAGNVDIVVAGGMESMSNAPYVLEKARGGYRMGHGQVKDHMFLDGLEDAASGRLMGAFAQDVADEYGLTREAMDAFAVDSLNRALKAIAEGATQDEMVAVTVSARKGDITVTEDEQPGTARPEKIPHLKPAFAKDGTITAANSSSISDGASAIVLANEEAMKARDLTPLGRIVAHVTESRAPEHFSLAPIGAINKILAKTGWDKDEVDLYEINEAFAMVTMLATQECQLDPAKVNISGGACAKGHPIGSSGSRIIASLVHALRRQGGKRGIAALCIGGGEATAVAVEVD